MFKSHFFVISATVILSVTGFGQVHAGQNRPLSFIQNQGQWDTQAEFTVRSGPVLGRLEPGAIVLQVNQQVDGSTEGVVVRMTFEDACDEATLIGINRQSGTHNFFVGDRSSWSSGVPSYEQVAYQGLYDRMDLLVRDGGGHIEYDLLAAPGADISRFVMRCEGVEQLRIRSDGALVMRTALGELIQHPPTTWYERSDGDRLMVDCRFRVLDECRFGFEVPSPAAGLPLVIDPRIEWATYLGGSDNERVLDVTVNDAGLVTVAGRTFSNNFPTTAGAYDTDGVDEDGFVARFSADGSTLVWATHLGGLGMDRIYRLFVDELGNVTLAGGTEAADFPTTPGAYDESFSGTRDAFVSRLSSDGSSLIWSTFIGGNNRDRAVALGTDASGSVTIGGYTASIDFPVVDGFDETHNGSFDVFASRLSADGTTLEWSTLLGGIAEEGAADGNTLNEGLLDLVVHDAGQVTLAGMTRSNNFPVTVGDHDPSYNGGNGDAFISRLDPAISGPGQLLWSTFLGGSAQESAQAVCVDARGVVTIAGFTYSSDLETTSGAYDETFNLANDVFVARLDPASTTSQLEYLTYIGGAGFEAPPDMLLHDSGRITIGGFTFSSDFPTTANAKSDVMGGSGDAYVSHLSLDGNGANDLVYSSFVGGMTDVEIVMSLALIGHSDLVVGGDTRSSDFPVTAGAYDQSFNGGVSDAWVARLDLCPTDIDDDGLIGITDMLALLAAWGPNPGHHADLDDDGVVGITDLLILLGAWGACP